MEALIILAAIAVIIVWIIAGKEFARIAAMKGHTESRYFWWTFLLPPVGMAMVIALPDIWARAEMAAGMVKTEIATGTGNPNKPAETTDDELPEL